MFSLERPIEVEILLAAAFTIVKGNADEGCPIVAIVATGKQTACCVKYLVRKKVRFGQRIGLEPSQTILHSTSRTLHWHAAVSKIVAGVL